MKKILYISYDGLTDPLGQSQILPYLTSLTKYGYKFTILSFEKKNRYESYHQLIAGYCHEADIEWVPLFFTSRPPILAKIYDRWQMRRKAFELHRKKGFHMIHCRSYIAAEMGLQLKRKFAVKFLFDMRGFWADEKVDGGQWDLSKLVYRRIYRHYKKKEREFLQAADSVISLTEAAKIELQNQPQYSGLNIKVIPCCADLNHFDFNRVDRLKMDQIRNKLGIPHDRKILSYLGSVGGWYMTTEMFSFFKTLRQRYPEFVMLVLSKDSPERIRSEAEKLGIPDNALFISYASRPELPEYMGLSTCSIFFIRPTYSKMASSPTKHAELMGMGLPVICNDLGDTGKIITDTFTGYVVKGFQQADFDEAVNQIPALLEISPQSIRSAAFRYFDLQEGVQRYLSEYQRIMD